MSSKKKIQIVYFSGTDGMARAASCFEKQLTERGTEV